MADAAKPIASPAHVSRAGALWSSSIGRKFLMAITGLVLLAYVIAHMLGNLQVFAGTGQINKYASLLHASPQLLWTARVILLVALGIHVVAGAQLHLEARAARPVGYEDWRPTTSTPASRTMIWSGILIFAFVVYHILDLTVGVANPAYREGDVFHNVVVSFGRVSAVVAYLIAMIALGFHLWHGVWSLFQSLGWSSRRIAPGLQRLGAVVALILAIGFASIPIAVLIGLVKAAP